jgi:hypothetical protein
MDIKEWEEQQAAVQPELEKQAQDNPKQFRDFDQFFDERKAKGKPLVIRLFGQLHELPSEMPALLMVKVMRAAEVAKAHNLDSMQQALSDADVLDMAEAIFGRERLDAFCAKGLGIEQLGSVVEWCAEQYQERILGERKAAGRGKPGKPSR